MRFSNLFCAIAFVGLTGVSMVQSQPASTEIEKLNLEREKFAYEKSQSTRNLILGFGLTTLGGAYFTWLLSRRTWSRQTTIDLYKKRYDEGIVFLDTFSKAVGERFFLLQRFLWVIGDPDPKGVQRLEKEYFQTVVTWNSSYWVNRNKIRLLVDDAQANAFLDYQDDFRLDNPQSLHYLFVKAHRNVLKVKDGSIAKADAQLVVDSLNWACSAYLENLTTSFLTKAISLQLLKSPVSDESSLKAAIVQQPRPFIPPRLWGSSQPASFAAATDPGKDKN